MGLKSQVMILSWHLVCCQMILSYSAQSHVNDESSLLSIKSLITSDPNNIITSNWSQGTSFCTWTGVKCSLRRQRVTALNLFGFNLSGTISPHIGNLSFLTYMNIGNNSFTGEIPGTIGNLFRLRRLGMQSNLLSASIPPSLGLLRNLELLSLEDNNLKGTIPWGIFNMTSLQVIRFSRNQLSGELPPELCRPSSKLQQLYLGGNKFVGEIPTSILKCAKLRIIFLSENQFTGNLPVDIGNMQQLQVLALGANNFTGSVPPSIGNLTNLWGLDLSRNNLTGLVPSEMGYLSSITFLNLELNNLNGELPQSIFNLTQVERISVSFNFKLSGTIPQSIGTGLPNVMSLLLSVNKFSGDIPNTISNLSQLLKFDIADNLFTGHMPITIGNLHRLTWFNIGQNQFTNDLSIPDQDFLTSLTNCRNLTTIIMRQNLITGALPVSIGNFSSSLLQLYTFSCRITGKIPSEIGNLTSLILLNIESNNLAGEIPNTLGNLKNMQQLVLSGNNLKGSLPESLCQLENLFKAGFGANSLSGKLPRCLGTLPSLRQLFLHNNSFSSTIPLTLWTNIRLEVLSLSGNQFHGSVPREIENLGSLLELYLNGNQLSGNIPETIGELQSLTTLQLQNNMLNGSIPPSLANMYDLQYLDFSQNNLSGPIPLPIKNLVYLNYFNVSFNELTGEIPDGGCFRNFTSQLFAGNKGLCGSSRFGVKPCPNTSRHSRVPLKYILPSIASVIIVLLLVLLVLKRHCRKLVTPSVASLPLRLTHQRISFYEILRATSNLNPESLIGKGNTGSVYRGMFSNQMVFAVKVFDLELQGAFKSFDTECEIMRSLRHRNLVKIISTCSNLEFKALVMEYMPNGNLHKWLHSPDCGMNIDQRLHVMVDVAHALEYLHHGYSHPIVHCDLKPSNILLDEDMVARVGDFGIAKLLSENQRIEQTKTLGTIGYMAPEYGSSGLVSTLADIYSYGILLMETFTGKSPTDELFLEENSMNKWVSESFPGNIMQIVDVQLLNEAEGYVRPKVEECMISIMELAIQCATDLPDERPKMNDVLVRVKKIHVKLSAC